MGQRGTRERVDAVLGTADQVGANTVLDLGCAEGYVVRRCAENGMFTLGVDADARRLAIAQMSAAIDGLERVGFVKAAINGETLEFLPRCDLVVCLSVMHHVMYESGLEPARELLKAIHRRTGKALVFEMGQSDESSFAWSRVLPDMGAEPHAWIMEFVESAGFRDVVKLAEVASLDAQVRRAVLVGRP